MVDISVRPTGIAKGRSGTDPIAVTLGCGPGLSCVIGFWVAAHLKLLLHSAYCSALSLRRAISGRADDKHQGENDNRGEDDLEDDAAAAGV